MTSLRWLLVGTLWLAPALAVAQATGSVADGYDSTARIDGAQASNITVSGSRLLLSGSLFTGDGADGACSTSGTFNINTGSCSGRATPDAAAYTFTGSVSAGATAFTLSAGPPGLAVGDELLFLGLTGTLAGTWETRRVASIGGAGVTVTTGFANAWNASTTRILVQRVPNYASVTVNAGSTLLANGYDGSNYGVVFFRSRGAVTVAGSIDMSARGFRGTPGLPAWGGGYRGENLGDAYGATRSPYQNNGGGGGGDAEWCHSGQGGGGGGYGTAGANGLAAWYSCGGGWSFGGVLGFGGSAFGDAALNQLFLGPGGGGGGVDGDNPDWGGEGGPGGGIIAIFADSLTVTGGIRANGGSGNYGPGESGGGGGGAGGAILIRAHTVSLGSGLVAAVGGAAGGAGRPENGGGNGGLGRIAVSYDASLAGATSPAATTSTNTFATSGYATSTNLFSSIATPARPGVVTYNLSALPSGTTASMQFSKDGGTTWVNAAGASGQSTALTTGTNRTIDLTGLGWWTTNFRIRVNYSGSGASTPALDDYSVAWQTDTTAPSKPTVSVSRVGASNTFTISWTAATDTGGSGIASYTVQDAPSSGSPWVTMTSVTGTSLTTTMGGPGTYGMIFRVIANDGAGNSTVSDASAVVIVDWTPPAAPGTPTLSPSSTTSSSTISWSFTPDSGTPVSHYDLYVAANGSSTFSLLAQTTTNSYVYAPADGTYVFQVRAIDEAGQVGPFSASSPVLTVDSTPPTPPFPVTVSPNPTQTSTTLSWAPSVDAGGGPVTYTVNIAPASGGSPTAVGTTSATSFVYSGAMPGKYMFGVFAQDSLGNTSYYGLSRVVVFDQQAPTVPGIPAATPSPSSGNVTVSWTGSTDDLSGVASYELRVSDDSGSTWTTLVNANVTTYAYAAPEGKLVWSVRAVDAVGNASAWSASSAQTVVDRTAPTTPGTPSASPNPSSGQVAVTWAAATDAGGSGVSHYRIEVSAGGAPWTPLATSTTGSWSGTATQGVYRYRIVAFDKAGNASAASAPSASLVVDETAPAVPDAPVASPDPSPAGEVVISWQAATDSGGGAVAGYDLEVSSDDGLTFTLLASVTGTSFRWEPTEGRYLFHVRAIDTATNPSDWSADSDVLVVDTTAPTTPGVPTLSQNPSAGTVDVAWTASTDAGGSLLGGYLLEISDDSGASWSPVKTLTTTQHPMTLAEGSYLLRVRAFDGAGNESAVATITDPLIVDTTAPAVPGVPALSPNPTNGLVTLTWTASADTGGAGLDRYEIEVATDGTTWTALGKATTEKYAYSPVEGTYRYRVRARDRAGNASGFSARSDLLVADTTPPEAPDAPDVQPNPSNGAPLTVSWTAPADTGGTGVASYDIERSADGTTWTALTTSTDTSIVDTAGSGTWRYRVAAVDGAGNHGAFSDASVPALVTRPPTADDQAVATDEDTAIDIALTGSDPEHDALTYAIVTPPAHGALTGTPPNVRYAPASNANGADSFTFRVSDGTFTSDVATVHVTVRPVNDAPVAQPQEHEMDEDGTLDLTLAGGDVEDDTLTFAVVDPPEHGTLSGIPPALVYRPAADFHGEDAFTYKANDGALDSGPARVHIVIDSVNDAPVGKTQTLEVAEGSTLAVKLAATDVDGDDLTYRVFTDPAHGLLTGTAPSLTYDPEPHFNGEDSFVFVANDGTVDSAPVTVKVTVVNLPPTVEVTADALAPDEGTPVQFGALTSDPGNDTLTFHWDFGDGATSTAQAPSHAYADEGTYTAHVLVDDGDGGKATAEVTLVVSNAAPALVLAADPPAANEGALVALHATGTDPGADALTYHWDFGDGTTSDEQEPMHAWLDEGTYTVTATVDDGDGATTTETLAIVISNAAPAVSFTLDPASPDEGQTAQFTGIAVDPGRADVLTFAWAFGDGETSTEQSPVHTFANDGEYEVVLTVSDGDGATTESRQTITVKNVAPAVASLTIPETAAEGAMATFTATANDAGGHDALAYHWNFGDGVEADGAQASHAFADDGHYTVTITVTDDGGAATTRTGNVTIENVAPTPHDPGAQSVEAGELLAFTLSASDPANDHDTLTWVLVSGPGALTADGQYSWTPDRTTDDAFEVTVQVEDEDGGATTLTIPVLVHPRDGDDDGVLDRDDNCVDVANAGQEDKDGNGIGDACDGDIDGDGVPNVRDVCPLLADPDQADMDKDGQGDACDDDIDGDGITNARETGLGMDPKGVDSDHDTVADKDEIGSVDEPRDTDEDGTIDALDPDSDNDGVSDADEAGDADLGTPPVDTDHDGKPDGLDDDTDGDGVLDTVDVCRLVSDATQLDTDGDKIGDACDGDLDGDGVANETDNCAAVANDAQADLDHDGKGDACDGDRDGDGVENGKDNCPDLGNADQADKDADQLGDACDAKDDRPVVKPSGCGCAGTDAGSLAALGIVMVLAVRRRRVRA